MCGIVGAIADRNVTPILLEGLRRLEYRGYDSAGLVVRSSQGSLERLRCLGKVAELVAAEEATPKTGHLGISHTRWATHGAPSEDNAHPHISHNELAIVHNGIIENYVPLRDELKAAGYEFSSQTDSEAVAHLIHRELKNLEANSEASSDLLSKAVALAMQKLEGAYAIAVINTRYPDQLVAGRKGSPLVIGIGIGEHFVASDQLALLPVTNRFMHLEDGDMACIEAKKITVVDIQGNPVERAISELEGQQDSAEKGEFRHYMLKEIYEQPHAVQQTLEGRIDHEKVLESAFGPKASDIFDKVKNIQILACGTSYHAGVVARYWFESIAGIPCQVEIASEFRYRKTVVPENTLLITISQSGETADTLAALRSSKDRFIGSLCVCNVPTSSLVRETELNLLTHAGPEVGVASTKAFTTQLTALFLLVLAVGRRFGLTAEKEAGYVQELRELPQILKTVLESDKDIETLAGHFGDKNHSLFLGRGVHYPVAMEGALKLKEISYIHAEAYAAGELKHGPLALVDQDMPVVAVAPNDELVDKLKSNLQEVRARGGQLFVFADENVNVSEDAAHVIHLPAKIKTLSPIAYSVPLQLLSYHVALIKGTDVDQPRNLAKSVTVE